MAFEFVPGWAMRERVFDNMRARIATRERNGKVVISWSLGAQRALERAAATPWTIDRLVLIAATPCFVQHSDWPHGLDAATLDDFAKSLACDVNGTLTRFVSLQAQGDTDARGVMRELRCALREDDHIALSSGIRALRDNDLRPLLARVECPVLVIHGARDALVPRAAAEYLVSELPSASLAMIDGAAHAPFISRCDAVVRSIDAFLA